MAAKKIHAKTITVFLPMSKVSTSAVTLVSIYKVSTEKCHRPKRPKKGTMVILENSIQ